MESSRRPVVRIGPDGPTAVVDELAVESPLEIRLGDVPIAVVMRTPGRDEDLALGFALTEAIVAAPDRVAGFERVDGDRLRLVPAPGVHIDPEQFRRNTYTTSSCGVCGKASIDAVLITAPPAPPGPRLEAAILDSMVDRLRAGQRVFDTTGGLHGAGIFDPEGTLLSLAEDVGRHNAVDKAIGTLARARWPIGETVMIVSGRISFEVMQKAGVVGIPVVAGVSAASSLATELATDLGATLVGFVRDGSAVVYAGGERLGLSASLDPDPH